MATFTQLQGWCSPDRLAQFLRDANGDERLAVNTLDAALSAAYPPEPDPWYSSPRVLSAVGLTKVTEAADRIRREGKPVTHGRVVAALPYGFWDSLFGKRYAPLWQSCLRGAFPRGPRRRTRAAEITGNVRNFSNRLAHHERILHQDLATHHLELLTIPAWVDPGLRTWIAEQSRVPTLLGTRPA